jgi:CRP/FNR family transcriptional regulator, cyclic AMP receptor protein
VNPSEILALASQCPMVRAADGDRIVVEGDRTGELFVLASGELDVRRHGRTVVRITAPGAVVGELGFLLAEPASADVVAAGDVTVYRIDDAEDFFVRYPGFARYLATLLARRLRQVSTYLSDLQDQFADRSETLGLVHVVLGELVEDGGTVFDAGSEREPDSPY